MRAGLLPNSTDMYQQKCSGKNVLCSACIGTLWGERHATKLRTTRPNQSLTSMPFHRCRLKQQGSGFPHFCL